MIGGFSMNKELMEVIKSGNIVIPLYLFKNYKEFNLELEEFIFLMYLYNSKEERFDPNKISNELKIDLEDVMNKISSLTSKDVIEIISIKNKDKVMEDYISLDPFYNKLNLIICEKENTNTDSTVYDLIEKEFGRTLSPIEYEIIKAWVDDKIKEELIVEAVREATFNGVSNLRYIDKILYEWKKAGIKSIKDVEDRRKAFKSKKGNKKDIELFDYDWFEDEE